MADNMASIPIEKSLCLMRHYDNLHCMGPKPAPISISSPDLRLLRVFMAVVRNEGFAAAQNELGLSPGTISNHITSLETRFGVRLCERGRKGFSLTAEGERIHEAAVSLLRSIDNFSGIVGSVRGELTGTLHFGTVDAMHTNAQAPVHRAIAQFRGLAPKVMLHIEIASPQDLLQRLVDGRYSVILTPTAERHPSVEARPLYQEEQRLYCGRLHPLFPRSGEIGIGDVREHAHVGRTYEKDRKSDTSLPPQAMTSHMEAIAILVKSGHYLGYLPTHFARPFVERGDMKSLLDRDLAYFDTFYLMHRKEERNRAATLLCECLSEVLAS
jgi:DNA-binding transcriptional LysR family regulator